MIYVFKTTVKTRKEVVKLSSFLNELILDSKWNFDLKDCDRILRIDSLKEISIDTKNLLRTHGFECDELVD